MQAHELSFTKHHLCIYHWMEVYLKCSCVQQKMSKKLLCQSKKTFDDGLLAKRSFEAFLCDAFQFSFCVELCRVSLVMEIDPNLAWKASTKDASMLHNFQQGDSSRQPPKKSPPIHSFATIAIYIHKAFASLYPKLRIAVEKSAAQRELLSCGRYCEQKNGWHLSSSSGPLQNWQFSENECSTLCQKSIVCPKFHLDNKVTYLVPHLWVKILAWKTTTRWVTWPERRSDLVKINFGQKWTSNKMW